MASVVIIHAADDALPARALGEKLRQAKLTAVIEKPAGEERQNAIKGAVLTIALWSPKSSGDAAAADDASFAKSKGKLVHATMQSAPLPEPFRGERSVDLTGWRGEDDFAAWRELAQLVTEKAGVAPLPPPAPRPPSGFFQPGRVDPAAVAAAETRAPARAPAPQRAAAPPTPRASAPRPTPSAAPRYEAPPREPTADTGGGGKMLILGAITFVVVALIGGVGYFVWNQSQTSGAASAWEQVDTGDASALRAFIDDDPGEYRDEAQTALAALDERSFEAAMDANSVDALEGYLNDFPNGANALAARGRIAELQSATAPPLDPNALPGETVDPDLVPPGAAAPTGPVAITPAPTPAPEPTPEPAPSGGIDLTPPAPVQ